MPSQNLIPEPDYIYSIEFAVRDYECDLQGVVNNANYQHYFEHARHEFLVSKGISFAELHDEGTDLVIIRVEIDYKYPLRSRERFVIQLNIQREGNLRLVFLQDIYRLPDRKLIAKAKVTGTAIKSGKPVRPGNIFKLLDLE
jgi:acyl-CoA thioester hydrolase